MPKNPGCLKMKIMITKLLKVILKKNLLECKVAKLDEKVVLEYLRKIYLCISFL